MDFANGDIVEVRLRLIAFAINYGSANRRPAHDQWATPSTADGDEPELLE